MSAFLDRLADVDVPPAAVGGIPTGPAPEPVQEPPQFAGPAIGGAVRPRVPAPPRAPELGFAPGELVELWGR